MGSGSLGCWTGLLVARGLFRQFGGFVGESLLLSPISRALAPDVTSVCACVLPHGHEHGLGALGLGVGWGLGLCVGCLPWHGVFFSEGLLGAASRYLPKRA